MVRDHDLVAHRDAAASDLAGGQFEHAEGAPGATHPRRFQLLAQTHDPQAAVEEHDVEREPHEPGVDRRHALQQQSLAAGQRASSEQPPHPREHAVGDHDALAEHGSPRQIEDQVGVLHNGTQCSRFPRVTQRTKV